MWRAFSNCSQVGRVESVVMVAVSCSSLPAALFRARTNERFVLPHLSCHVPPPSQCIGKTAALRAESRRGGAAAMKLILSSGSSDVAKPIGCARTHSRTVFAAAVSLCLIASSLAVGKCNHLGRYVANDDNVSRNMVVQNMSIAIRIRCSTTLHDGFDGFCDEGDRILPASKQNDCWSVSAQVSEQS